MNTGWFKKLKNHLVGQHATRPQSVARNGDDIIAETFARIELPDAGNANHN
jgi:hypothetical protein